MNKTNPLESNIEKRNKFWLTPEQIQQWLEALLEGGNSTNDHLTFPMSLLNQWYEDSNNNGYLTQQQVFQTEEYKKIASSENSLLQEIAQSEYLPYYSNYNDLWIGNGIKLWKFINNLIVKPSKIFMTELEGHILGNAKKNLKDSWLDSDILVEDITNFLSDSIKASKIPNCLHISFWQWYGNLNSTEEERFFNIPEDKTSGLLISVCKKPENEALWEDHMKAYGGNTIGKESEAYKASKNQILKMLIALWFSQEHVKTCDLGVKRIKLWNGNETIRVGRESSQDISIQYQWKKYLYRTNTFYPMYDSIRFSEEYFVRRIQQINDQRISLKWDTIEHTRENDLWMALYIKKWINEEEKKKKIIQQTKDILAGTLWASFFWILFLSMWRAMRGRTNHLQNKEKNEYNERNFSEFLKGTKYDTVYNALRQSINSLVYSESIGESEIADPMDQEQDAWSKGVVEDNIKEFLSEEEYKSSQQGYKVNGLFSEIESEYYDKPISVIFKDFILRKSNILPLDEEIKWDNGLYKYYGRLNPIFTNPDYQHANENSIDLSEQDYNKLIQNTKKYKIYDTYNSRYLKIYNRNTNTQLYALLLKDKQNWYFYILRTPDQYQKPPISYEEHKKLCQQYHYMLKLLRYSRYIPGEFPPLLLDSITLNKSNY
jgi:hypothetical protein